MFELKTKKIKSLIFCCLTLQPSSVKSVLPRLICDQRSSVWFGKIPPRLQNLPETPRFCLKFLVVCPGLQAPVWFLLTAVGELQALLNKSQRTTCCTTTVHLHTQHTHTRTHVVIFISDAEIYL